MSARIHLLLVVLLVGLPAASWSAPRRAPVEGQESSAHGDGDLDGDGIPDGVDDDIDGDGIPNAEELDEDSDGDGALDYRDPDSDDDGIPDGLEPEQDLDGDGVPARLDPDDEQGRSRHDLDGDGIPNRVEPEGDADGDGIPNRRDLDSDGDEIPDREEAGRWSRRPRDSDRDGTPDYLDTDSDGDGRSDAIERGLHDGPPADLDGDGIPNHLDTDADGDGVPERPAIPGEELSLLAPRDLCPEVPEDFDGSHDADGCPEDSDQDGVPDALDDCLYRAGAVGCPEIVGTRSEPWRIYLSWEPVEVYFEPAGQFRWALTEADDEELQRLAVPVLAHPQLAIVVGGCASPEDATGRTDTEHARDTARRYACCRGLAVHDRLVELGVEPDRVAWGGCPVRGGGDRFSWPEERLATIRIVDLARGLENPCDDHTCRDDGICR